MTSVLLIYPYFRHNHDRSIFRFPPLGLGYLASSLKNRGYEVQILDCTFMERSEALARAWDTQADVVGIYSMVTMLDASLLFARHLRNRCNLLVAGGPLPSGSPGSLLRDFDVVVIGEGEQAMPEVLAAYNENSNLESVPGIAYRNNGRVVFTPKRDLEMDLDRVAFPARNLFQNRQYIDHWKKRSGQATTTVFTTRGCPFSCEFCSNAVFGVSYRERSPKNILDEVEEALSLGYERIHFADDVFTLNRERILGLCEEIASRRLHFAWECLSRVDSADRQTAEAMKNAGCDRVFFGIESGNDSVLAMMNKKITADRARRAVVVARSAGLRTGAFFILCYPGETDDTVLQTLRFANSLPLDYLSFTMPYPLPGTALYERVKDRIRGDWRVRNSRFSDHTLIFKSDFSERKMKFAILKGQVQFSLRKRLGRHASVAVPVFQALTDPVFRILR